MKNETVLVTGGTGHIGSALVYKIATVGRYVVALGNTPTNMKNLHNIDVIQADIRDRNVLKKIFVKYCPSAVVHMAALTFKI